MQANTRRFVCVLMNVTYYLISLGVVPVFAFRAFLPLLATALVARIGPELEPFASMAGIALVADLPAWISDDTTLAILAGMSLLEIVLAKVPEARELLRYSETQLKAIAAFLTCFYLVEGNPQELLDHLRKEGLSTDYAWGQSFAYAWSFAIGTAVWLAATLRRAVYGLLTELDEEDTLGLQRLLSWMEDGIGFFGVLLAIYVPAFALVFAGATLLGLWMVRRWLEAREARQKAPCPACGRSRHLCATRCPGCDATLSDPREVGWLGVARAGAVTDLDDHRLRLIANKRCKSCAERLRERRLDQRCPECDLAPFASNSDLDDYLASVGARLSHTLGVCFALGLVPLVGLIPGILYYRMSLIASLRHYLPVTTNLLTRWFVRIVNLCLIVLQPVPILGALTLPAMCLVNYSVYRGVIVRQRRTLAPA
jgi:hypothetical protein